MTLRRYITMLVLGLGAILAAGCGPNGGPGIVRSWMWNRGHDHGGCEGSVGAFRVESTLLHTYDSGYRLPEEAGGVARVQLAYAFWEDAQVDLELIGTFPEHLTRKPGKAAVVPMWERLDDPDAQIDSGWTVEKPTGSPEPETGTFEISAVAYQKIRGKVSIDFRDGTHATCTFTVEQSD